MPSTSSSFEALDYYPHEDSEEELDDDDDSDWEPEEEDQEFGCSTEDIASPRYVVGN